MNDARPVIANQRASASPRHLDQIIRSAGYSAPLTCTPLTTVDMIVSP
jgi:hypothetical protein